MDNFFNPSPEELEIKVDESLILTSKIGKTGVIEYLNHAYSEVSGYEEYEVIGESMDLLNHPDMPLLIYDMLRERFEKQESMRIVNKVLAKDGRYFWLITDFETKVDENGETVAHYSISTAATTYAVHKVESIYKILTNIEMKSPTSDISQRYFKGFLEERGLSYDEFVSEITINRPGYEQPSNNSPIGNFNPQSVSSETNVEIPNYPPPPTPVPIPAAPPVVQQQILDPVEQEQLFTAAPVPATHQQQSMSTNTAVPQQQSTQQTTPQRKVVVVKKNKSILKRVFGK